MKHKLQALVTDILDSGDLKMLKEIPNNPTDKDIELIRLKKDKNLLPVENKNSNLVITKITPKKESTFKYILGITGQLLINATLVVVAIFLLRYLLIPAILVTLVIAFFKRKIGNGFLNLAQYFIEVAVSVDQLANVVCADLLDLTLIKKGGYRFGNPDETISGVLGKNQKLKELSLIGKGLNFILSQIEKDHSIKSIEEDENN